MSRKCPKCSGKTVNNGVEGEGLRFLCISCDGVFVPSNEADTKKLNVSDQVIAEMLARVAAGRMSTPGGSVMPPEAVARYAQKMVESLLQFRAE